MARKIRKTQEQLAFPELEQFSVPTSVLDGLALAHAAETNGEVWPNAPEVKKVQVEGVDAAPRRLPRKRGVTPKMVLISESVENSVRGSVQLPPGAAVLTEGKTISNLQEAEQFLQVQDDEPPVVLGDASPVVPKLPLDKPVTVPVAANEQFSILRSQKISEGPGTIEQSPDHASNPSGGQGRLKFCAHLASIAASLILVLAMFVGLYQFTETQKAQRESIALQNEALQQERNAKAVELNSKAVELFLKYNELTLQLNVPVSKNAKRETRYWKENLAISLLESLFNMTRGNREWEASISWALEKHGRFLREQRLTCAAYSSEFVRHLERVFSTKGVLLCRDLQGAD